MACTWWGTVGCSAAAEPAALSPLGASRRLNPFAMPVPDRLKVAALAATRLGRGATHMPRPLLGSCLPHAA